MPNLIDPVIVAVLAIGWPLYDRFVDWPRLQRWAREDAARARQREYASIIAVQWLVALAVLAVWMREGRSWAGLGLVAPSGWRLWLALALLTALGALYARQPRALARMPEARERVRRAAGRLEVLLPHTTAEFRLFLGVAVTAGVCEELLYRGYLITVLATWVGWWGAATLSAACFGLLHAYQGRGGIIRTALVGVAMTGIVALTRSIFPAMALHALIDIGSGVVTWIALRETPPAELAPA